MSVCLRLSGSVSLHFSNFSFLSAYLSVQISLPVSLRIFPYISD